MTEKCAKPGCTGNVIDDVCQDCGRLAGGKSVVAALADGIRKSIAVVTKVTAQEEQTPSFSVPMGAGSDYEEEADSSSEPAQTRRAVLQPKALGAGLIELEPLPKTDPDDLILKDPQVPEDKRSCGTCGAALHRTKGFCPKCGLEYSIVPSLSAGDIVANQYEIKGPIAFGGLGWIYLAWDKVLSRLVILKGLLNSKDAVSAAASLQERRYLAAVKHPNIVGVHNFVIHGREGFIVMEFVAGKNLKQVRQENGAPLPVPQAIAFILRILSAFAHLHKMGLIYCDFKPDNFMYEDDDVKLIDMGAVRRVDDHTSDIFCTRGYCAPEAADKPSVVTDLYTIGRTLAVLIINFKYQSEHEHSLPTPIEEPLLARYESLYRFLLKATEQVPAKRFQSADEMAGQLLGVLCESLYQEFSHPPFESYFFEDDSTLVHADTSLFSIEAVPAAVGCADLFPVLRLDTTDSAAAAVRKGTRISDLNRLKTLYEMAAVSHPDSAEAKLRLADARAQSRVFSMAEQALTDCEKLNKSDWRLNWYHGKLLFLQEKPKAARQCFEKVYAELPGELAPKLAIAMCAECECDVSDNPSADILAMAARHYETVGRCDHGQVAALFGLARSMLMQENRSGALEALGKVPSTSTFYTTAQTAMVRILTHSPDVNFQRQQLQPFNENVVAAIDKRINPDKNEIFDQRAGTAVQAEAQKCGYDKDMLQIVLDKVYKHRLNDLSQASSIADGLDLEEVEKHRLKADLLLAALELIGKPLFKRDSTKIAGSPLSETQLRKAAESELRACARYAVTERERCRLIDEANSWRPLTIF